MPFFSIVIPVYNRGSFIPDILRGLAQQRYSDFEVIFIDDGSTDGTNVIVDRFLSPKTLYFRQEHSGPSAARNLGLQHSSGSYVIFLDSDDEPYSEWLYEISVACSLDHDLVFCGFDRFKGESKISTIVAMPPMPLSRGLPGKFLAGIFAIRREIIQAIGGYSPHLGYSENFELGLRVLAYAREQNSKIAVISKPLIRINVSGDQRGRWRSYLPKIAYSTLFIIKKHAELFDSHPKEKILYLSILSRTFYKMGKYRWALVGYKELIGLNPLQIKFSFLFFLSAFRGAQKKWKLSMKELTGGDQ